MKQITLYHGGIEVKYEQYEETNVINKPLIYQILYNNRVIYFHIFLYYTKCHRTRRFSFVLV